MGIFGFIIKKNKSLCFVKMNYNNNFLLKVDINNRIFLIYILTF